MVCLYSLHRGTSNSLQLARIRLELLVIVGEVTTMHLDATQLLIFGSLAASAIWLWRFTSLLGKTPRTMRAAALRGSARAMGSEFWEQGGAYQGEIAEQLAIKPDSIVHTLQWPNNNVEVFSFQEVRHGRKGRLNYHYWVGYRFSDRVFPKFDLRPSGAVSFIRRGWWRKVSLPGQIDFASRFMLTGEDSALIEQFFTPGRCVAILAREWPRGISMKAGGHWVLAHREQFFQAASESDSETSVSKEIQDVAALVTGMLPLAEALTDSQLGGQSQRYVGLSQDCAKNARPWWDRLAVVFVAAAIALSILFSIAFLGRLWAQFDRILDTEPKRYLFAILFVSALWAIGEWVIRSYQGTKQRAATRLEAQFSTFPNSP